MLSTAAAGSEDDAPCEPSDTPGGCRPDRTPRLGPGADEPSTTTGSRSTARARDLRKRAAPQDCALVPGIPGGREPGRVGTIKTVSSSAGRTPL
jgi:hypothetical protein